MTEPAPHAVYLSDVEPDRVEWLSRGRLARGKLTVLDGDPGLGKSTLTLAWAAMVSRGHALPDGPPGSPRGVVLLSAEDGLADTIRPRLEAAGADLSRVAALVSVPDPTDPAGGARLPALTADLGHIESLIVDADAALLIVDPLMAYLGGDTNAHRDQDVRRALAPLAHLAECLGVAVILVRHLNKAQSAHALYRGGGSIGIIGAARCGLLVAEDPDDPERRVLAPTKSNLAKAPAALSWRLITAPGTEVATVEWLGESRHRAGALLAEPDGGEGRSAAGEAEAFLAEILSTEPVAGKDVQRLAREAGIAERTLRRARERVGVVLTRQGFGSGSMVLWSLTAEPATLATTDPESPIRGQDTHTWPSKTDGQVRGMWPSMEPEPPAPPAPATCLACQGPLPGGQSYYCSPACHDANRGAA